MSDMMFHYQERFACPGLPDAEDINSRFAELDPFLEGFFLCAAREGAMGLVLSIVDKIHHSIAHDEERLMSVVGIRVEVLMKMEQEVDYAVLQGAFMDAMAAFLGTRFPAFEGLDTEGN